MASLSQDLTHRKTWASGGNEGGEKWRGSWQADVATSSFGNSVTFATFLNYISIIDFVNNGEGWGERRDARGACGQSLRHHPRAAREIRSGDLLQTIGANDNRSELAVQVKCRRSKTRSTIIRHSLNINQHHCIYLFKVEYFLWVCDKYLCLFKLSTTQCKLVPLPRIQNICESQIAVPSQCLRSLKCEQNKYLLLSFLFMLYSREAFTSHKDYSLVSFCLWRYFCCTHATSYQLCF